MNLQEALRIVNNFGYDFNKSGGRAVMPSRINEYSLRNNGELQAALEWLDTEFSANNGIIEDDVYLATRNVAKASGEIYAHWIKKNFVAKEETPKSYSNWGIKYKPVESDVVLDV